MMHSIANINNIWENELWMGPSLHLNEAELPKVRVDHDSIKIIDVISGFDLKHPCEYYSQLCKPSSRSCLTIKSIQ